MLSSQRRTAWAIGLALPLVVSCAAIGSVSEDPSSVPASGVPSVSLPPSPPSATPSALAATIEPDSIVRAVLPGIALRQGPGLTYRRMRSLPEQSRSFVVSGPVEGDGYHWILLSSLGLPPGTGCEDRLSCEAASWFGWAATGDPSSDVPWFISDPTDCPKLPGTDADTAAFMLLGDREAVHCYGHREIEFTGWMPLDGLHDPHVCASNNVPSAWLFCPDGFVATVDAVDEEGSIRLFVDPASGIEFGRGPDYWPIITGHYDDPASKGCAEAIPAGWPMWPQAAVLECRAHFVVTRLGAVAP